MSGDTSLDEKRIYGETRETTRAFVGSDVGLTEVTVSGDRVGRFSLVRREPVRDLAGSDGQLLVATEEDVLVGTDEGFEPSGFGAAVAVGLDGTTPMAAGPDGRVARLVGDDWRTVGEIENVTVIDGPYVGAAAGLARYESTDGDAADGSLVDVGLDDVTDVDAVGPYTATGAGLFAGSGEDWTVELQGPFRAVAVGPDRTHAVGDDHWVLRDGEWVIRTVPTDEPVVDVAFGECTYAVTESGTFLVEADPSATADGKGGWRSRALGVGTVTGLAVP